MARKSVSAKSRSYSRPSKTTKVTSWKKTKWNPFTWFLFLSLAIALPLTLYLTQQQQNLQQEATSYMPYEKWLQSVNLDLIGEDPSNNYAPDGDVDLNDYTKWLADVKSGTAPLVTPPVMSCERADVVGTTPPPYAPDGLVDIFDLTYVKAEVGQVGTNLRADVDQNGVVEEKDAEFVKECMYKPLRPTQPAEVTYVTILSPQNGSTVSKYGAIKITASASDSRGIQEITIQEKASNKVLKLCRRTSTCTTYWSPKSGTHTVVVKAKASRDNSVGQAETTFTRP